MLIDAAIGMAPQLQQARTLQVFGSTSAIDWLPPFGFLEQMTAPDPLLPFESNEAVISVPVCELPHSVHLGVKAYCEFESHSIQHE